MIDKTEAIVLRVSPFSRTSHVVNWLSRTHGKVATLVKGACRPKSPFLGQYDLFYTCELLFYRRAHNGLHIARECAPLNARSRLRSDWRACACASYICDVLSRIGTAGPHRDELYELAAVTLDALCVTTPAPQLVFWFELQLMSRLGLAPQLRTCPACGNHLPDFVASDFSCDRGGILCADCAVTHVGQTHRLAPDLIAMLRNWQRSTSPRSAQNTSCSHPQCLALRDVLALFLNYHLDIPAPSRNIATDILLGACPGMPRAARGGGEGAQMPKTRPFHALTGAATCSVPDSSTDTWPRIASRKPRKDIRMKRLLPVLALILTTACTRKPETPAPTTGAGPVTEPAPQALVATQVLVSVAGDTLTRFEADLRVRQSLARLGSQIPPDRVAAARQKLQTDVCEQFIDTVLLRNEADRRGIVATDQEQEEALDQLRSNLPTGVTMESLLSSPTGEGRMRREVVTGIKVQKLLASVSNELEVSDERISRFHAENTDKLQTPETVRARHILLSVSKDDNAQTKADKRASAESIRKELVDGADFSALARQHSTCPSRTKGGDLGTFPRGSMVKAFEDAAFSQEPHAIGPVVETRFGFHIIEVMERKGSHTRTREQVADILRRQLHRQAVRDLVQDLRQTADIEYPAE